MVNWFFPTKVPIGRSLFQGLTYILIDCLLLPTLPTDLENVNSLLVGENNKHIHTGLGKSKISSKRAFPHDGAHSCPSFEMVISCYLYYVPRFLTFFPDILKRYRFLLSPRFVLYLLLWDFTSLARLKICGNFLLEKLLKEIGKLSSNSDSLKSTS